MTKEVLVCVSSSIEETDTPGEVTELEIRVPGTYYSKNGKHYVLFEEQEGSDASMKVTTRLILHPGYLDMKKTGYLDTAMLFEEGRDSITYYAAPYGKVLMGIATQSYQLEEEEQIITAKVQYTLSVNYELVSKHALTVTIRGRG